MAGKTQTCALCERNFGNAGAFALHKRIHTPHSACKLCHFKIDASVPHRCCTPDHYIQCQFCSLRLYTEQELNEHVMNDHTVHVKTTSQKLFYNCSICQKRFKDKFLLAKHTSVCSKYQCSQCMMGFPKRIDLQRHLLTHSGDKPHQCNICNQKFRQKSHLRKHCQKIHGLKDPMRCDFCTVSFRTQIAMSRHINKAHPEQSLSCQRCVNCKMTFQNEEAFKEHLPSPDSLTSFNCDMCCRRLKSELGLIQHKKTHTYRTIVCPICDVQYIYKSSFYKHMSTAHSDFVPCVQDLNGDFNEMLTKTLRENGFELDNSAQKQFTFFENSNLVALAHEYAVTVNTPSCVVNIITSCVQTEKSFEMLQLLSDSYRTLFKKKRVVWIYINTGGYLVEDEIRTCNFKNTLLWLLNTLLFRSFKEIINDIEVIYRNWDSSYGLLNVLSKDPCELNEILSSSMSND